MRLNGFRVSILRLNLTANRDRVDGTEAVSWLGLGRDVLAGWNEMLQVSLVL